MKFYFYAGSFNLIQKKVVTKRMQKFLKQKQIISMFKISGLTKNKMMRFVIIVCYFLFFLDCFPSFNGKWINGMCRRKWSLFTTELTLSFLLYNFTEFYIHFLRIFCPSVCHLYLIFLQNFSGFIFFRGFLNLLLGSCYPLTWFYEAKFFNKV